MNFSGPNRYLYGSVCFVLVCYFLAGLAAWFPGASPAVDSFVASELLNNDEGAYAELISALLWFLAFCLFSLIFWRRYKHGALPAALAWYALYSLLAFFAFGEEVSWGDHLFDYSSDLAIAAVNAQGETNIHNLNLANLIGLPESSPLYYWLSNLGHLLTPAFYLLLAFLWVVLPFLKQRVSLRLLRDMPEPALATILFYLVHLLVFLLVDTWLFNVGQIFEMFIGLFALLVAIDVGRQRE